MYEADLVIGIGTRSPTGAIGNQAPSQGRKVLHIDIDPPSRQEHPGLRFADRRREAGAQKLLEAESPARERLAEARPGDAADPAAIWTGTRPAQPQVSIRSHSRQGARGHNRRHRRGLHQLWTASTSSSTFPATSSPPAPWARWALAWGRHRRCFGSGRKRTVFFHVGRQLPHEPQRLATPPYEQAAAAVVLLQQQRAGHGAPVAKSSSTSATPYHPEPQDDYFQLARPSARRHAPSDIAQWSGAGRGAGHGRTGGRGRALRSNERVLPLTPAGRNHR